MKLWKDIKKWTDEELLNYLKNYSRDSLIKAIGKELENRWDSDLSDLQDIREH